VSHKGGLSIGAKAGIGVGVAFGAIAVICILTLLYFQRHRKQADGNISQIDNPIERVEADSHNPQELLGQHHRAELPIDRQTQELVGDHQQRHELAGWGPQELDGAVRET
jgi:hypothetical protein